MNAAALLDELKQQQVKVWAEGENLRVQMPKGAVTPALRSLIAQHKTDLLAWLKRREEEPHSSLPAIQVNLADRYQPFPLTDIQHAYWLGQVAGLALNNSYHIYQEVDCNQLDIPRMQQAWQRLIDYHEVLRAVVLPTGQQQILPKAPDYAIAVVNLTALTEAERQASLLQIRQEMAFQVFDLSQWPLFDIRVTQLDATRTRIHISMALIMLDGSCLLSLLQSWNALYIDPTLILPPLELSYRDYVLWTVALKNIPHYQEARAYWQNRLDSLPPAPQLPVRRGTGGQEGIGNFVHRSLHLDAIAWQQLKQRSQQAAVTPTALLAAAFAEVLTTWGKEPRFTLNCTFFNRPAQIHPQIYEIWGDFTSVTLLEVDNANSNSLLERARRIHRQLWQDLEYQSFNGVRVIQEILAKQKNQTSGLMPIVFTSLLGVNLAQKWPYSHTFMGGEKTYGISQTPQVLLDVQIFEEGDTLTIVWDVIDGYFPPGLIQEMFDAFSQLVQQLIRDEACGQRVNPSLLPPAQLAQRAALNQTGGCYPEVTLQTLFRQQVATRQDAPAVMTPQCVLSYAELYRRANAVAHWLQQAQAGHPLSDRSDRLVAIVMEKGWQQVVAVFGVLLAGAAYVPIDPQWPAARRHFLLQQSDTQLVLTQSKFAESLSWPTATKRLAVDTQVIAEALPMVEPCGTPNDLAYVLYTSGSTGDPKGVMIEQRSIVNRMSDIAERFGLTADDRVLGLTALHHDLSVFDILGMLAIVGGTLVLPTAEQVLDPNHWAELMQQRQVTLWNSVPAFLQMLVEHLDATAVQDAAHLDNPCNPLAALRWVILAGDFIPVSLPDRLRTLQPTVTIIASGGPTETTVWDIYYPIGKVDPTWASIPYGKPLKNARYYILNENLLDCPTWVPGELYSAGTGLARGYWQDQEKSEAKFIIHPVSGERLYRSGDLGCFLPNGNIEIHGRADFQIKIHGHRIELNEIEAHLLQHPAVKAAVVQGISNSTGPRQLVAYIVLHQSQSQADQQAQEGTAQSHDDLQSNIQGIAIHDHIERLAFKLKQLGMRSIVDARVVALPKLTIDEAMQTRFLSRQSYRTFWQEAIPLEKFSEFLACLMQLQLPNSPLPKYRYPSAGGLYPIQCYLYVKEERVAGLSGGFYYYHPLHHQLVWLHGNDEVMTRLYPAVNQSIFAQAGFALFLIADEDAIQPLYGELTANFCLLEAGYISQLLMMEAPAYDLGLCPVGVSDPHLLDPLFQLNTNHRLVHSLVGGGIDPLQKTQWVQNEEPAQPPAWHKPLQSYLAERLPSYMLPVHYIELDRLPLTANGKVDRKALPLPMMNEAKASMVAPANDLEEGISAVLQEMLALPAVSVEQNFAELGLSSVHIVRFNNLLKTRLNRQIPIAALFQYPTIRALADYVEGSEPQTNGMSTTHAVPNQDSQQRVQARLAHRQPQRK